MNRIASMILAVMVLVPASAVGQVCVQHLEVPDYPPIMRAAGWKGVADLTITVGTRGQVVNVEGKGSLPILVDHAKENVKGWVFCEPKKNGNTHVQLRYDYRLEGAPVYPWPTAKIVIDLGAGTIVIASPPGEPEP